MKNYIFLQIKQEYIFYRGLSRYLLISNIWIKVNVFLSYRIFLDLKS